MDTKTALQFLATYQAPDWEKDQELLDKLYEVVKYFKEHPTVECIRPLMLSMGRGLGDYYSEEVVDVLSEFPKGKLLPVIIEALNDPNEGVQAWTLQFAANLEGRELVPYLRQKIVSEHSIVRFGALLAFYDVADESDVSALEQALEKETDDTNKEFLAKIIAIAKTRPKEIGG